MFIPRDHFCAAGRTVIGSVRPGFVNEMYGFFLTVEKVELERLRAPSCS